MKLLLLLLPLSFFFLSTARAQGDFTIMSWNVENAFDIHHDAGKNDEEFLPEGNHRWSWQRFFRKLNDIAKTIVAIDSVKPIDIIGLCEVENDTVLTYLTQRTPLHKLGYRYIMTHSPDERGIDVALLYAHTRFRLLSHESIRVPTNTPTRDVLHATGIMPTGDTLDIYLLHLPSKLGGAPAAQRRKAVTGRMLQNIDSVTQARPHANIIVMGDFNDELTGRRMKPFTSRGFIDVMDGLKPGTYKFQGQWSTLDHILIKSTRFQTESHIATLPFLLESDPTNGGQKPRRTFLGTRYNAGISDHLPVWMKIKRRE